MTERHPEGHPILRRLFGDRLDAAQLDRLATRAREVTASGEIYPHEGEYLERWLDEIRGRPLSWPADILLVRLGEWLIERREDVSGPYELIDAVMDLGGSRHTTEESCRRRASSIAFRSPATGIRFPGKVFCFIGRFLHGSRKECQREVNARGGLIATAPTANTDYVVVGLALREGWIHSPLAREIRHATRLRDTETRPQLVSELDWVRALE